MTSYMELVLRQNCKIRVRTLRGMFGRQNQEIIPKSRCSGIRFDSRLVLVISRFVHTGPSSSISVGTRPSSPSVM
jgi:hypothetical protein